MIQRGQVAAAGYEFDLAQRLLRLGLTRSRGSVAAALPLLELLVDQMAAYAEAVAVAAELSREARTDDRVRLLLALAAAHSEKDERAHEYIVGLEDPRVLEVHVILATAALREGDDQRAAQHVARGERLGFPSPDLMRLRTEIASQRSGRYRAAEEEIEGLWAVGQEDEAERAAQVLLERYPESKVARKAISEAARRRREVRCHSLLAQGEAALAAGDARAAAQLFRQALATGVADDVVASRLAVAVEREWAADARSRVEAVLCLISGDDSQAALLGYLALDDALRLRVRAGSDSRLLPWLDALGLAGSGSVAGQAAVESVVALDEGLAAFAAGNLDLARRRLEPHRAVLAALADGRRLLADLDAQAEAERRERSRRTLSDAEEAFVSHDLPLARRLLEGVDRRALDDGQLQRLETVSKTLHRAETLGDMSRRVEAALTAGDPLSARAAVEKLVALTGGEEQATWIRRREEIVAEVRRRWRVEVVEGDGLPNIPLRLHGSHAGEEPSLWLDDGVDASTASSAAPTASSSRSSMLRPRRWSAVSCCAPRGLYPTPRRWWMMASSPSAVLRTSSGSASGTGTCSRGTTSIPSS